MSGNVAPFVAARPVMQTSHRLVRIAIAGLLTCPLFAAAADGPLKIAPVHYTERTLANGLQVIAAENHASPTVAVQVWYHVGAKDDPQGRSGFAHLFEHLMFKGTRRLKDEQFDRLTEDVGGENNAFTSNDVTAYHEVVPSNHLETLLWAEAERMSNLNVNEPVFKSERAVVEEEYRQRYLAQPYGRLQIALAASYLVHPYQRPAIGNIENLEAATIGDVVAFHDTFYRPDNATLVVTGDFEPAQLQAWVDRYFAPLVRPGTPIPRVTVPEPPWTDDRSIEAHAPKVPLPAVAFTWLAPPRANHRDAAALEVAAALLSLGDSSRLNQALVYRQRIATSARFRADLRAGPGLLIATAIAAGGKSLPDVAAALSAEIEAFASHPVGAAELAKAKTQILTAELVERETPLGLGQALAEAAVLDGNAAEANRGLTAIEAVTAADVQRVMREYVVTRHRVQIDYTQDAAGDIGAKP
jgi:zinc protease